MGMLSLQRRVQLKVPLETPISSHFWFPKRCLNRIDCPLMKLGLVPQIFFCYKKIPVEEQLHPSKGLFQSKGCNSCIMHLPLILKHRGHSMFGMIRIWNSSTSLELRPFSKASKPRAHKIAKIARLIYRYMIYDIWCNNVIYDIIYMYTLSTF